jgi:ribosomal protein S12 methylthiotransferase accessory factor YcaO
MTNAKNKLGAFLEAARKAGIKPAYVIVRNTKIGIDVARIRRPKLTRKTANGSRAGVNGSRSPDDNNRRQS